MTILNDFFKGLRIGFAMTGSFCTFEECFKQAEHLVKSGSELLPIMSEHASYIDTKFGIAAENVRRLTSITGRNVMLSITEAETIGPKDLTDIMVIAPCTSNTAAKLAASVNDTTVTMAVKSHLRRGKPIVLAFASNDSLMGSAKNLGELFNRKNYYFVPMNQDDWINKPASLVADFSLLPKTIEAALNGKQLRPIINYYSSK
jgi:Phosphopantothenoylcysteine synthetase/decarboxylase